MYDYDKDDADKTIRNNENLIYHIIKRNFHWLEHDEDAIQCARIGMFKAWKTFDPDKGYAFATYATKVMLNEVRMYMRRNGKFSKNEVCHLEDILAEDNDGKVVTLGDRIPCPRSSEMYNCEVDYKKIESELSDRDKAIIHYLDLGYTQNDIGEVLGISQSYASRLIKHLKRKLILLLEYDEKR